MISRLIGALDDFLLENYQVYLDREETELVLSAPEKNNQDEVDLDKYRGDTEIFLVPNGPEFDVETLDGSRAVELSLDLYVFLRGDTTENLYAKVNHFADALLELVKENPLLSGTIGEINIERIQIYQAAEGKKGIKGFKAEVKILDEI